MMRVYASKLAPLIESYLEFRSAMGRCEDHAKQLWFFDCFCCENYPELKHLSREAVRGWISDEIAHGRRGLKNKSSAIRMLAKYLGNGAYVLPTHAIPKKQNYTPYILTDDELAAFFLAVETTNNRYAPFLQETVSVLWRLLYTCGLRPREGRLIKCSDICFQTREILISEAKGNKERIVIMSSDMLKLCESYNTRRSAVASRCEYFFVSSNGNSLKADQLNRWIKHCWAQACPGTPPHLLPNLRQYDLRHRYASAILQKWLDEGRNLYAMLPYLRTYMGHEKFADTAYYIHILPENLLRSPGVDWNRLDAIVPGVEVWEV